MTIKQHSPHLMQRGSVNNLGKQKIKIVPGQPICYTSIKQSISFKRLVSFSGDILPDIVY